MLRTTVALAALAAAQATSAAPLRAQGRASGGVQTSAPAVPAATTASRLPRLLDGGARSGGQPGRHHGAGQWSWPSSSGWSGGWADGWSVGAPTHGGPKHGGPRRPPRRAQPLIVFVSPYASVYASSASMAGCGWTGAAVTPCSAAVAPVGDDTAARRAVRTKVIEVTPATAVPAAATMVAVEWLRDDVLRLHWAGGDTTVREVELVVADSARRVLASQRVHAPPYTAVFARDARTAMVGVGVLRTDGTSTLSLAPLGPPAVRRD